MDPSGGPPSLGGGSNRNNSYGSRTPLSYRNLNAPAALNPSANPVPSTALPSHAPRLPAFPTNPPKVPAASSNLAGDLLDDIAQSLQQDEIHAVRQAVRIGEEIRIEHEESEPSVQSSEMFDGGHSHAAGHTPHHRHKPGETKVWDDDDLAAIDALGASDEQTKQTVHETDQWLKGGAKAVVQGALSFSWSLGWLPLFLVLTLLGTFAGLRVSDAMSGGRSITFSTDVEAMMESDGPEFLMNSAVEEALRKDGRFRPCALRERIPEDAKSPVLVDAIEYDEDPIQGYGLSKYGPGYRRLDFATNKDDINNDRNKAWQDTWKDEDKYTSATGTNLAYFKKSLVIEYTDELNGDILSAQNIRAIANFEKGLRQVDGYMDFCNGRDMTCANGNSLVDYIFAVFQSNPGSNKIDHMVFDGEGSDYFSPQNAFTFLEFGDDSITDIYRGSWGVFDSPRAKKDSLFLPKDAVNTVSNTSDATRPKVPMIRTVIEFRRYFYAAANSVRLRDRSAQLRTEYEEFLTSKILPYLKDGINAADTADLIDIRVSYGGDDVLLAETNEAIVHDGLVGSAISMTLVCLYVLYHFRFRIVLTVVGMFSVFAALPIAFLVLDAAVPDMAWQITNMLSVFLVCGIGADYMFLAFDGWQISKTLFQCDKATGRPTVQHMGYFTLELLKIMLTAAGVTVLCFMSLGFLSTMASMRQFGLFMTLVIIFLVVMVLFVLVPFLVFLDRFHHISKRARERRLQHTNHKHHQHDDAKNKKEENRRRSARLSKFAQISDDVDESLGQNLDDRHPFMHRFFWNNWAPFVLVWRRWIFIIVLVLITGALVLIGTNFSIATNLPSWFSDNNPVVISQDLEENNFASYDDNIGAYFARPLGGSMCHDVFTPHTHKDGDLATAANNTFWNAVDRWDSVPEYYGVYELENTEAIREGSKGPLKGYSDRGCFAHLLDIPSSGEDIVGLESKQDLGGNTCKVYQSNTANCNAADDTDNPKNNLRGVITLVGFENFDATDLTLLASSTTLQNTMKQKMMELQPEYTMVGNQAGFDYQAHYDDSVSMQYSSIQSGQLLLHQKLRQNMNIQPIHSVKIEQALDAATIGAFSGLADDNSGRRCQAAFTLICNDEIPSPRIMDNEATQLADVYFPARRRLDREEENKNEKITEEQKIKLVEMAQEIMYGKAIEKQVDASFWGGMKNYIFSFVEDVRASSLSQNTNDDTDFKFLSNEEMEQVSHFDYAFAEDASAKLEQKSTAKTLHEYYFNNRESENINRPAVGRRLNNLKDSGFVDVAFGPAVQTDYVVPLIGTQTNIVDFREIRIGRTFLHEVLQFCQKVNGADGGYEVVEDGCEWWVEFLAWDSNGPKCDNKNPLCDASTDSGAKAATHVPWIDKTLYEDGDDYLLQYTTVTPEQMSNRMIQWFLDWSVKDPTKTNYWMWGAHQFWNPDNPAQVLGFKFPFRVAPTLSSSRETLKPLMDAWKAATEELRLKIDFSGSVDADRTGINAVSQLFVRYELESSIINSTALSVGLAFVGIVIGMLIATRNVNLVLIVSFCVACICIFNLAFMVGIMKWELGAVQVLGMIVFLGYAMTFCLHMAHGTVEQKEGIKKHDYKQLQHSHNFRYVSARFAIHRMGKPIIGSAMTTIASCIGTFFCYIIIFQQFAIIVMFLTAMSVLFALVVQPAILMQFGPPLTCCGLGFWKQFADLWNCQKLFQPLREDAVVCSGEMAALEKEEEESESSSEYDTESEEESEPESIKLHHSIKQTDPYHWDAAHAVIHSKIGHDINDPSLTESEFRNCQNCYIQHYTIIERHAEILKSSDADEQSPKRSPFSIGGSSGSSPKKPFTDSGNWRLISKGEQSDDDEEEDPESEYPGLGKNMPKSFSPFSGHVGGAKGIGGGYGNQV